MNMYDSYNKEQKTLSTKAVVLIVLVVVLAFIEVIALGVFLIMPDSESKSKQEDTKIVYVQEEKEDSPAYTQQPMQQPIPETKTEVVVVTVPPKNNSSSYMATTKPNSYTSSYTVGEVENFVANSVYAYVDGINNNSSSYVTTYFSPGIASSEAASFEKNSQNIAHEEVLSMSCSGTKLSENKFSVIRKSTIEVVFVDGNVKNVTETYKYTVVDSNGQLYITSCNPA